METGPNRDPSLVAHAFEKHEKAFREATLPLYGLGPEWRGSRSIGGYEFWESEGTGGNSAGREYGMVHGDGHPDLLLDLPYLRVVTSTPDVLGAPLRSVLESEAEPPAGPEEIERAAVEENWDGPPPGAVEHTADILVDGEPVVKGQVVRVVTTGGGGWGDPLQRELELVLRDVIEGRVSLESARDDYGVVFKEPREGEDSVIDAAMTKQRRAEVGKAAKLPSGMIDRGDGYEKMLRGEHKPRMR